MKGFTTIELIIIVAIIGILAFIIVGAAIGDNEKDRFMTSCLEHERQYECEYKWKQMHPDPVVVFAPFNR